MPRGRSAFKNYMKILITKRFSAAALAALFCIGCSTSDSTPKPVSDPVSTAAASPTNGATAEKTTAASPCANRYFPVKNGLKRNYKNTVGGDTAQTMEYADGAAQFTEVTTLKGVVVKHVWNCTGEGLIAANYGSAGEMGEMKIEPKHVSGVTLPNESEIRVGKTWQTVYTATGTSEMGAVDVKVTLNNKIVALEDAVKTPAGTFKAVKIEMEIDSDMKFGGRKMPVPVIKSAAWFAPEVGMVKSTGGLGGMTNSMEYTGSN